MLTTRFLQCGLLALPLAVHGETLLYEQFSYADGELAAVSNNTWTVPNLNFGSSNPRAVVNDGALEIDWGLPETDPRADGFYTTTFAASPVSSGHLYARFSLTPLEAPSADSASSASTYLASFWNNGSGFRARLWYGGALDDGGSAIPGRVRFGMTDGSGSRSGVIWDTTTFPVGEPVEVVVRYDVDSGIARLSLDPADADDYALEVNDSSALSMGGFGFRHKDDRGSGIDAGKVAIDDLFVSTTFEVQAPDDHPPSDLLAQPIPGRAIGLSWVDNAQGETGYAIERRLESQESFVRIGGVGPNETSYVDEDVLSTDHYVYRVAAEGVGGVGPSNESEASPYVFFYSPPAPETFAEPRGDGAVAVGVHAERQVSYQPYVSTDLSNWERTGPPVGEGANAVIVEPSAEREFYAFSSRVLDVPPGAGLSGPFVYPETGGGATIDASDHGAVPSASVDQSPALQAALNAASAGDTVEVGAGDYYVASRITVPGGVIFRGSEDGETRLLVAEGLSTCLYVARGSTDLEILDFAITAAETSYESAVTLNDRYTTPQIERVRIARLRITKFARLGIDVRNARHVLVEHNTVRDATELGGGGSGYGIQLRDDYNHDNWVRGNVVGPVLRHGVLLQYRAHNNLIEGNTAIDNTEDAYDLHGEDESYNEFRGNLAYWRDAGEAANITAAGFGIGNTGSTHADTGPGNWIHHNTVYNYTHGVDIILGSHFQYIDSNHFYDLGRTGVRITNGGANFVYLRDNLFETTPWGISGQSADYLEARGNRFVNNAAGGINLSSDSENYLITENDFLEQPNPLNLGSDEGAVFDNPGTQ